MNTKYIEFKKKRELGDILSDTFAFLRYNYKPLFSILMKTAGIPFILVLAATAYYTASTGDLLSPESLQSGAAFATGNILISVLLLAVTVLVFYGLLFGTVLNYIKVYIQQKGEVQQDLVIQGVKKDWGGIIGLAILSGIMIGVGFMFCIIPGIYLYVPLSLVFTVMVFRNKDVSDSITESFQLVKNEWWMTFATLLVMGIVVGIIGAVFTIPSMIYMFINGIVSAEQGSAADLSGMFDWVYVTLNTIASAIRFLLYIITAIATAFIYFNLNERKNLTGTFEKIDALGKSE